VEIPPELASQATFAYLLWFFRQRILPRVATCGIIRSESGHILGDFKSIRRKYSEVFSDLRTVCFHKYLFLLG